MKAISFCEETCETGANVFHSSNNYILSFARKFKLRIHRLTEADQRLFLFDNGYKPVFSDVDAKSSILTPFRLLWRYGLSLFKSRFYVTSMVREFIKIYQLQDQGDCFDSPALLLKALSKEFPEMTKHSFADWMQKQSIASEKYMNELSFGILSNIYCHDLDVHAFVGLISSTCSMSDLYFVEGGAEQIPKKLVETALIENPADVSKEFIHATVKKIIRTENNRLRLSYELKNSDAPEESSFDYVISAIPHHQESTLMTSDDIKLPKVQYHAMNNTLLSGNINYSLFGLPQNALQCNQMVSFLPISNYHSHEKHPVRSIMHLPVKPTNTEAPDGIWSIFSEPKSIPDPKTFLSNLILKDPNDEENRVDVIRWLAYPKYHPVADPYTDLGQFKLAPGVYYPNAIELAASCMEMAIIGGRNVALMIAKERIPPVDSASSS
ncbi:unnamed protein product [Heterobilharzia americana]|nr:unnamed protein product [Heterobilharzia americana]